VSKIMIVDDEIETLTVLSTFLDIIGHQAVTTDDPRFAVAMAEREQPDCVLLDVMMPDIDGFTLCKQMRLNPRTKALPIMFITAYAPLDLEDRRRDAGADMVLLKPFGLDALTRTIDSIMIARPPIVADAPAADYHHNNWTFRRDANTGVFSSTLRDFLANMSFDSHSDAQRNQSIDRPTH
jgi:CheY-like chemotaxis protein